MTTAIIPTWTLGDRIRKARILRGMDQRQFADALGVKAGTLAGWETDRQRPRNLVEIARKIQQITEVPASWILGLGSLSQEYVTHNGASLGKGNATSRSRSGELLRARAA